MPLYAAKIGNYAAQLCSHYAPYYAPIMPNYALDISLYATIMPNYAKLCRYAELCP